MFLLASVILLASLQGCLQEAVDSHSNDKRSYLIKAHPFLKHTGLSKEMRDLLNSKYRRKRQYLLYRQTGASPTINYLNPAPMPEPAQVLGSTPSTSQYIIMQSQEPAANKNVESIVAGAANMPNVPNIQLQATPPSNNVNELIKWAANSAMQTELSFRNIAISEPTTPAPIAQSTSAFTRSLYTPTKVNPAPIATFTNLITPLMGHANNKPVTADPIRVRANIPQGETCETTTNMGTEGSTKNFNLNNQFVLTSMKLGSVEAAPSESPAKFSMNSIGGDDLAVGGNMSSVQETLAAIKSGIGQLKYGRFNGEKEGMPCSLRGSWKSAEAGVMFNVTELKETEFDVPVVTTNDHNGFFNQSADWQVSALMPFPRLSLMVVTAIHESTLQMATFTGECRICDGREFVSGHWLLVKNESSCEDLNRGQEFFGDLWTRCA